VLATGDYIRLFRPLFESVGKFFLPGHSTTVFLFTDHDVAGDERANPSLHVTGIKDEIYPAIPMKRYECIDANRDLFRGLDYLFCCDASIRMVAKVSEEILPDAGYSLVGVEHPVHLYQGKPGFFHKVARKIPFLYRFGCEKGRGGYERDERSTAYVGEEEGGVCYTKGFWGGRTSAVLEMAEKLRRNIEEDWSWGFVAWGNDESHLNRYFVDYPPKTLPPAYWWPEALWVPACYTPWRNRIIAVRKDNDEFRSKPF